MKIDEITLQNFRSAPNIHFSFNQRLNLLVGVNGAGKSTVLDALGIGLSWLIKRIERDTGRGRYIDTSSLRNEQTSGALTLQASHQDSTYQWLLPKVARGASADIKTDLSGVSQLAQKIKAAYQTHSILPVIAYYSVDRLVAATQPGTLSRDNLTDLDIYDHALGGKTNYQSFFAWFRMQDDILNENAQSQSKWMQQNNSWVKHRVKRVFKCLQAVETLDISDEMIKSISGNGTIYQEPQFLLLELSSLLDKQGLVYQRILQQQQYLFHKISAINDGLNLDLTGRGEPIREVLDKVVDSFSAIADETHTALYTFCWEVFTLATLLGLWWLSDDSKQGIKTEFKRSKQRINKDLPLFVQQLVSKEQKQKTNAQHHEGRAQRIVTQAIEQFLPEYTFLRVKRLPYPHMLIDKNGRTQNLDQLSDGEKNLIALVGDIARRLAIGNPHSDNSLQGEGVILIDEIDLHLHPAWQRVVIPKLLEVFSGCQFFISTHSPQVISHVKADNIFLLKQQDGCLEYVKAIESYGKNSDRILEDLLGVSARPEKEKSMIHELFAMIQQGQLHDAKQLVSRLNQLIGDDAELVKANVLIKRKEVLGK